MTQEEYDIQRQVDALMQKVLETWRNEGKWDGDTATEEYYGLDKDPVFRLLLTAFVYQMNGLNTNLQNFQKDTIDEFENVVLPYYLTQAVPSLTMIKTAKNAGDPNTVYCDETTPFQVKRESLRVKELFSFVPLFKTKIVGARVNSITKVASDKWNVNFDITDQNPSLASMGFMILGQRFSDINVYWNNEKIPLVKPSDFHRFSLNPWFSDANILFNKSLLFGVETKWFDLWNSCNLNYFMVDPTYNRKVDSDALNLIFEFKDAVEPFLFDVSNLALNCFPAVNVVKKDFFLTPAEPVVKLSDEVGYAPNNEDMFKVLTSSETPENKHQDFFMNLVMNEDSTFNDFDRVVIRRFGCERFNINELLVLANSLSKRYESDFYAFQKIHKMQNTEKIRRLDLVVKDVIDIIKANGIPQSGIYAILKRGRNAFDVNVSVHLSGLFTDGAYANDIVAYSDVTPSAVFDKKETKMLIKSAGGKDELADSDEKRQLSRFYFRTADRIVTRADLKVAATRFLIGEGIKPEDIISISSAAVDRNGRIVQEITVYIKSVVASYLPDYMSLMTRLKALVISRSVNVNPVELKCVTQ